MSFGDQPSEDELRAAYEAEIKRIRVEQIVLEQVVSLVNLGMRRTGLAPGTEDERDLAQVRVAVDAVRALLPLIEQTTPEQAPAIREALSQLQLAFVRLGGAPAPGAGGAGGPGTGDTGTGGGGAGGAGTGGAGAGGAGTGGPGGPEPSQPSGQPAPEPERPKPGEPGPAQRSGRLWVPGQ